MVTVYQAIVDGCGSSGKSITLVSGRRWASDENGNRVDGAPKIKEGSTYKFVNSKGDVIWYSSPTSRHLYGEAIDIINGKGTSFGDVLKVIMDSPYILNKMFVCGMYCAVEQTKDDMGNTVKHFHIGKVDNQDSQTMKSQQNWWQQVMKYRGSATLTYGT